MKIAFLYDRIFPESVGGVEHRNLELGKALASRGHRVAILGPTDRARKMDGVEIRPHPETEPWTGPHRCSQLGPWATAMLRIPTKEFDLIEAANIPLGHLFPLDRRCCRSSVPLLVTWHEFWGSYWRQWAPRLAAPFLKFVERVAAGLGTASCAVSGLTAERVAAVRGESVPIIPNGVDTKRISATGSETEPQRKRLIYAGRLISEKRVDLLIRALSIVRNHGRDVELVILGDGPDRSRLAIISRQLSVASSVTFHNPFARVEDAWKEIARSTVAVQPSAREGFGLFPLEAMALGIPVIFCRSPESAVGELVRSGREGLAAEPDPEALAVAVERLLEREALRSSLGARARKRASQFDWSIVASDFEKVATPLVARNGRAPGPGGGLPRR